MVTLSSSDLILLVKRHVEGKQKIDRTKLELFKFKIVQCTDLRKVTIKVTLFTCNVKNVRSGFHSDTLLERIFRAA